MREKLSYLQFRHFVRMSLVVKENEAPDPVDVTLFSADAEMFASDRVANLVEQFWFVLKRGGT
jgi:hypothetical protein